MFIPKAVAVTALFTSLLFTGTASAVQYYPSSDGIQGAIKVVQYKTGSQKPYYVWRAPIVLTKGKKPTVEGSTAIVLSGIAYAPETAPNEVKKTIWAGNKIATKPYAYGGGHGSFISSGYDCSGSVSYALNGGRLLSSPLASGALMSWGVSGKGKWITVYSNSGHVWMRVAGVTFDTSGASPSRWQLPLKQTSGYAARHPKKL